MVFENFDFLGRTRTVDEAKNPVDTSARFALDGEEEQFTDSLAVSEAFSRSPAVASCVVQKMMDYAFAGNLYDPEKRLRTKIAKEFTDSGFQFQSLITSIVLTPEFLIP
jgi:hypothetical protein